MTTTHDPVHHPAHYIRNDIQCACGQPIECITVAGQFGFRLGSVIKYLWRAEHKGNTLEDLRKARQCLDFEIEHRTRHEAKT